MDPALLLDHIDAIGLLPVLLWQSMRLEKRLDAQAAQMEQQRKDEDRRTMEMVKGWEKQLGAMISKYEDRETEIRARYDRVVEGYNSERSRLFHEMDRKLDDAIRFFHTK